MKKRSYKNRKLTLILSGMLACLKPHPLGCARIPEHPKNKCLQQTTPFKVWWHIVFLMIIVITVILIFILMNRIYFTGFSIFEKIFNLPFLLSSAGRLFISLDYNLDIYTPQNITYNFSIGDNYIIDLNVSSNRNVTVWKYTLEDLKHDIIINNSAVFTPNATIRAVRWNNRITLFANDSAGNLKNESIVFFVYVNDSAPVILNLSSNVYACEGSYLSYFFNVSDVDEDVIIPSINPQYPSNPFYAAYSSNYNYTLTTHEIFSGILTKANAGGLNARAKIYSLIVYVIDGIYIDSKNMNITVIEINNAPVIQSINNTEAWTSGDNSSFYYQINATDSEDGNQNSGNLSFNISFSETPLFSISSNGTMDFDPVSSQIGNHTITICAIDSGLRNPHDNISLCGQNGSNLSSCRQFILTVTERTVEISTSSGGGGGGGGGGSLSCIEKWGCDIWGECRNLANWDKLKEINQKTSELLKINCSLSRWEPVYCGYQTRNCMDLRNCTKNLSMPVLVQHCYYTISPNCNDGIKNCHNDSCEILADCGGPCSPCPSCSDEIKNQGEEAVDCGGPCKACPVEIPYKTRLNILYLFLIIVLILIIPIIILIRKYYFTKKNLEDLRSKREFQ